MPITGTVDVAVHLHRIYNIDLFCRGVYFLKVSVGLPAKVSKGDTTASVGPKGDKGANNNGAGSGSGESGGGMVKEHLGAQGIPYMCLAQCSGVDTMVGHKKVPPMKEHRLQGPAVHGHYYHSRMFVIRYREEELELGEVVNFQIPVKLGGGKRWLEAGQKLVLQMELMFSKLAVLEKESNPPTNGVESGGSRPEDDIEESLRMEAVAVQRFEASLSGGHWGIHGYIPVTFSGVHFVRVDCMVHGVLRNLKLESPPKYDEAISEDLDESRGVMASTTHSFSSTARTESLSSISIRTEAEGATQDVMSSNGSGSFCSSDRPSSGNEKGASVFGNEGASRVSVRRKYTWFTLFDEESPSMRPGEQEGADGQEGLGRAVSVESEGSLQTPQSDVLTAPAGQGGSSKEETQNVPLRWRWGWGRKSSVMGPKLPSNGKLGGTLDTSAALQAGNSPRSPSPEPGNKLDLTEISEGVVDTGNSLEGRDAAGKDEVEKKLERAQKSPFGMATQCVRLPSEEDELHEEGDQPEAVACFTEDWGVEMNVISKPALRRRRKEVYSYFLTALVRALEAQATTKAWLRKILEKEAARGQSIPLSARPLWGTPDEASEQDVARVLRRLFIPDDELDKNDPPDERPQMPTAGSGRHMGSSSAKAVLKAKQGRVGRAGSLVSGSASKSSIAASKLPTGDGAGDSKNGSVEERIPPMASVVFPSLVSRYCSAVENAPAVEDGRSASSRSIGEVEWLEDDEFTCKALEQDVYALAMLGFMEWREFVSALPGCGEVLSKETSALWLAQVRQRWACQTTLHTCSGFRRGGSREASFSEEPSAGAGTVHTSGSESWREAPLRPPRFSYLETEIGSETFGMAVRLACADASAPYKLPLQDQQMFPEPEALLPVCLIQRYSSPVADDEDISGDSVEYDGVGSPQGNQARETEDEQGHRRNTPPTSPVWVSAFRRSSSTLPIVPPESPTSKTTKESVVTGGPGLSILSPSRRKPPGSFADSPRSPTMATVAATAAAAAASSSAPATVSDESSVSSCSPSPRSRPRRPRVQNKERIGHERSRTRSLSPVPNLGERLKWESRDPSDSVQPPPRLLRAAEGKSSRVPSPPASLPTRTKTSKSLSPFFGNKGLAFLSPISKRRPRQWEATGNASQVDQWRTGHDEFRAGGKGVRANSGVYATGTAGGLAMETNGELPESPIIVPQGGSFRAEKANSSRWEPSVSSPRQRSPMPLRRLRSSSSADGAEGRGEVLSMRVSQASTPLSPAQRCSRSVSPVRPPPKQMAERRQDSDFDSSTGSMRRKNGRAAGEAGEMDHHKGGSTHAPPSSTTRNPSTRRSLLDGVEQSSDLGSFFRQGEARDSRRRGRQSPRRRKSGGKRSGHSGKQQLKGSGRRGDISGYFASGLPQSRTQKRSGEHGGHTRRREWEDVDGAGRNGGEGAGDDDDEEDEGHGTAKHGTGAGIHVVVLHHGYCGSSMDMRLIKNYIRILAPNVLVLNAESNERDPHTSMRTMGENLAKEVHRFLMMRAPSILLHGGQGRLSFIAHSAGALVVRLALTSKVLRPALRRLHLFVSLGTPHLGTLYGASGLVRTGMWAMKRWTKSQLLEEIGLTDAAHPRDSLLCKLSREPGLEYFSHVVLVSADKDGYVPPQSARIQMCDASVRDSRRGVPHGQVVCGMARSILANIRDENLYRMHLWGGGKAAVGVGGGVDEYIGRAAHISMMDSPSLVCLLLCTLLDLIR